MQDLKPIVLLFPPVIALAAALLSGCAGQDTTKTGFISSYDGMQNTEEHSADLTFVDIRSLSP